MKKIIYIVTTSDITYQQPLIRAASTLQNAGYRVKMIGRKLSGSIPLTGLSFEHTRISCLFNKKWLFYLEFNVRVFFCLLFTRQDAFCAVDLDTALPVLFASALKKIPRIYDARELFTEMKTVIDRPRIHKIWKRIERYCLPKFKWGYAVSESIGNELKKEYGVEYITVRNISILKYQQPVVPTNQGEPYILYQGYVHQERGIEELIRAMKEIPMKLIICGTGNVLENCIKLSRDLELDKKIIFEGLVPPEQLQQFTQNAYIGINLVEPSGLNQYYSLANKFFDYMHAGLPQLTMNFPEYKRINDEYEIAVLIDDIRPDVVAKALNLLISDTALYQRLKENCRKAKQVLNWQNEEKKLVAFYQKVLN